MSVLISAMKKTRRRKIAVRTVLILACAALALPLAAQQRGPLPPPPPGTVVPSSVPPDSAKANASREDTSSHITSEPPAIPVEQIIQKFTQHEEEFRKERDNFTYTQIFVFQEIDENSRPDGEYRLTSDILFTPAGKRYEKVVDAPAPTLSRISMLRQDVYVIV